MIFAAEVDWFQIVDRYGLLGLALVVVLVTGYRGVWVWGSQLRAAEKREADWKDMAIRGTLIAERQANRRRVSDDEP